MRILTAGESHGEYIISVLEGFPKGVKIEQKVINEELERRASGVGRGKRMSSIEKDKVVIISGLRNKVTLGSPIAMLVKNKDTKIFSQSQDELPVISVPRPAHADLAGLLKYHDTDIRNILERASARETVARVCAGSVCKQFLRNFGMKIASFTVSVAAVASLKNPQNISEVIKRAKKSKLNCLDAAKEKVMIREIRKAQKKGDSLGGIIEVWIDGAPPGLGSFMHFDRRLDAKFASYLMSIPAIKGVEVGLGFAYAKKRGSVSHDAIYCSTTHKANKAFIRKTNNSGGIEGGISTGETIVLRLAMKPIATLSKPLDSVNVTTKKKEKAPTVRSDTCAIVACGTIAESMSAIAITECFLDKFGCDTLDEIKLNYKNYFKLLEKKF